MSKNFFLIKKYLDSLNNLNSSESFLELQREFKGLTGAKTAEIISKCVSFMPKDNFYLEIGVFQGANLVSVAYHNKNKKCIGVDSFEEHFQESNNKENLTEEQILKNRIEKYKTNNIEFYNSDFRVWIENNKEKFSKKIMVYMYDGPHSEQDQIDGVEMIFPLLTDNAVIIVDDLASENTQRATAHLLKKYKDNLFLLKSTPNDCQKLGYQQGQAILWYKK